MYVIEDEELFFKQLQRMSKMGNFSSFALLGEVDEKYFTGTVVPAIEKLQSTYMQILDEDKKIKKKLYGKK